MECASRHNASLWRTQACWASVKVAKFVPAVLTLLIMPQRPAGSRTRDLGHGDGPCTLEAVSRTPVLRLPRPIDFGLVDQRDETVRLDVTCALAPTTPVGYAVKHALMTARRRSSGPRRSAPRTTERRIVIRGQRGRPLDRRQKTFNRLIAAVEKLRTRLDVETRRFDETLIFHAEHIAPRLRRMVDLRTQLVRALQPYLNDRRLKPPDRRALRAMVTEQLDNVVENQGVLDDDLQALFERLHGTSLDDLERAQMDDARRSMEIMFADMGIDVDLSHFHAGMSEEELAAQSEDMLEKLRAQLDDAERGGPHDGRRRSVKKKTKRAMAAEERARRSEDLQKTGLTSIYRQLAKVLHPDLEPDPDERQRKGAVMQELTAAHAAGDLHTLLRLELEWIRHEGDDSARLTDEKLDGYNELLGVQVAELDAAINMLPFNPRYAPLVSDAGPYGVILRRADAAEAEYLEGLADGLTASLARLDTADAIREVREIIRTYKRGRPATS